MSGSQGDQATHGPARLIARCIELCETDDRIVAAFLGGSLARDEADAYSDIDLCMIVADDSLDEIQRERVALVRQLGDPLFIEDFGNEHVLFVIMADGTELELHTFRVSDLRSIRSGPHRVLVDKEGLLTEASFPLPEVDPVAQVEALRTIITWFWHDLGHLTTALGRGQLWWAAGQLEQLRSYCVNLARIEQGVPTESEPYWKLDREISTEPLAILRSTFVPLERDAMLRAGREVLASFRDRAPLVAKAHGLTYPAALDALVGGHFEQLAVD